MDYQTKLENLKNWTLIDVKDSNIKKSIIERIDKDLSNPSQFSIIFYEKYSDQYSILGKTCIQIMSLSKPWKKTLTSLSAISKFKSNLYNV